MFGTPGVKKVTWVERVSPDSRVTHSHTAEVVNLPLHTYFTCTPASSAGMMSGEADASPDATCRTCWLLQVQSYPDSAQDHSEMEVGECAELVTG